jgi:hypothetical protein
LQNCGPLDFHKSAYNRTANHLPPSLLATVLGVLLPFASWNCPLAGFFVPPPKNRSNKPVQCCPGIGTRASYYQATCEQQRATHLLERPRGSARHQASCRVI